MSRIEPITVAEFPEELRPILGFANESMGFTPNDVLTMGRWPELLGAMAGMVAVIFARGAVDMELKRLVAMVCSASAGCDYCVAHNALGISDEGVGADKLDAVWDFETSDLFTAAERAALRVGRGGGMSPNGVTDEEFDDLKAHFDDRQILEIVAVIGLFGFLNRWNATLATPLETKPREFAEGHLETHGWQVGKHG